MLNPKPLSFMAFGAAMALGVALVPAHADSTKACGTTSTVTAVTNPPNANAGFTQTTTNSVTQTSSCNSNSDNKQQITPISTGATTNKGGGTPGGH